MFYLRRIGWVLFASLASCAMMGLVFSAFWGMAETGGTVGGRVYRLFARVPTFGYYAAFEAWPIIPALAYAEYVQERRYVFYAICGALTGLLPALVPLPSVSSVVSLEGMALMVLSCATGLLAATVYWLIAGRSAGLRAPATTD